MKMRFFPCFDHLTWSDSKQPCQQSGWCQNCGGGLGTQRVLTLFGTCPILWFFSVLLQKAKSWSKFISKWTAKYLSRDDKMHKWNTLF